MGDEGGLLLQFRVLGPLEVVRAGEGILFRGSRERALLALLVLNANRTVSAERLAEDLWSGDPPGGAIRSLRVYVSRLRQALGAAGQAVVTRPSGYLLQVDPEAVDALRFEALVARGRDQVRAGDDGGAAATLREALALWRGPALADVADAPIARAEASRLEEARLAALEDRVEADLACGRHGEVTAELEALTREHPFRERLWSQRIVALYRSGRQVDALRAYQDLRLTLGEQLGIEPSSALQRLEGAVLRHDPELDWHPGRPAGPPATAPGSARAGTEGSARGGAGEGVVTFLFTDVVGSTELLNELGEEAAEAARRTHFGLLREAVAAHSGSEVKSLGDGLMVAFASPLAALRCAVEIQETAAQGHPRQGSPLAIRVGLHAGEPMRDDGDFHGTPVVVAKRLCDQAEGGQILASVLVSDLIGSRSGEFAFRHLGPLPLKGLAAPVAACEVVQRAPAEMPSVATAEAGRLPQPLQRQEPLPLVGRQIELSRLDHVWEATRSGQRQLVFLAGEPGIGKSRLSAEFARTAHGQGALVLFGRCDEGMGVPYQPFVEALSRYLRQASHLVLGRLAGELVRLVPEVGERVHGLPPPLRSDPETERYRLFDAVAAWLGSASEAAPVLFVIDDLHWATKPTLLLLSHLIRSDEELRLLLLVTFRDTPLDMTSELSDLVVELLRQPGVARIRLPGLDETGVGALMEAQAGHDLDDEGWALARIVHGETAGNPFYIREMLRHLAEKGDIVRRDGRWVADQPLAQLDVPDSVRDVVERRLTRLPDPTSEMLALAAVLGERFDLALLAQASDEAENSLVKTLRPAISARLVGETDAGSYHFTHALVRSTIEDALGPTRRLQLHRAAGFAVEAVHADHIDAHLPQLAHHFTRAREVPKAIDYASRAGDRAVAQLAHDEAAAYYHQALELLDTAGRPDREAQRCELLIALGEAQRCAGNPAHRETLLEAGRLAHQRGDGELAARAALANQRGFFSRMEGVDAERVAALESALEAIGPSPTALRARLLALLATELQFAEDERRLLLANEGLATARRVGDPSVLAPVLAAAWLAHWNPALIAEQAQLAEELAEVAPRQNDRSLEFQAGLARFITASQEGDLARADAGLAVCTRIAEALRQPVISWRSTLLRAHRAMAAGQVSEAEARLEEGRLIAQDIGVPDIEAWYHGPMILLRMHEGRSEEAVPLAAAALRRFPTAFLYQAAFAWPCTEAGREEEGSAILARLREEGFPKTGPYLWLLAISMLARTCANLDDAEAASDLHRLLRPHRGQMVLAQSCWLGPVTHHLGLLATTLERYDEADNHFADAAAVQERISARAGLVHTQLQWALMLRRRSLPGDTTQARTLLKSAAVGARASGLAGLLPRIDAHLHQT